MTRNYRRNFGFNRQPRRLVTKEQADVNIDRCGVLYPGSDARSERNRRACESRQIQEKESKDSILRYLFLGVFLFTGLIGLIIYLVLRR